jgi:hypothetical protein
VKTKKWAKFIICSRVGCTFFGKTHNDLINEDKGLRSFIIHDEIFVVYEKCYDHTGPYMEVSFIYFVIVIVTNSVTCIFYTAVVGEL